MFRKNNGGKNHNTAHYDVIDYTNYRRKCHFEEILDSHKIINNVIIYTKIIHFPVMFYNINFNYSATV